MQLSRSIVQPLKDFFFPPLCLSCAGRLSSVEEYLCSRCVRALVRVGQEDHTMTVLRDRFAHANAVAAFFPLYYFEEHGVLQHVIHALKYEGITALGAIYGEAIGSALRAVPEYADVDVIIPVPLHPQKERERGYNQSEWICRGIAGVMHRRVEADVVTRRKNTRTQTKLSAAERLDNVRDAFEVVRGAAVRIRGASILLVDDVVTTGATVHSCALPLRAAGARRVQCASIGIARLVQ